MLGVLLFAVQRHRQAPPDALIQLSEDQVQAIADSWQQQHGAAPDPQQLDRAVSAHLREEVLVREARRLGLDRHDGIVRRRLVQKMQFLYQDAAALPQATPADLEALLQAHPERYQRSARWSLTHVFIQDPQADVEALRRRLGDQVGDAPWTHGDAFLSPYRFDAADSAQLLQAFGEGFEAQLSEVESSRWQGPLRSHFGRHMVWIHQAEPARPLSLEEARAQVSADWTEAQRLEAAQEAMEQARSRYTIRIAP